MPQTPPLRQWLLQQSAVAAPGLVEDLGEGELRCLACAHRCRLAPGRDGICRVRTNVGGGLRVPWGYAAGIAVDPIEKKPFFHVLPGARTLSFGMLGCDLHCAYCQNWVTSQSLRDEAARTDVTRVSARQIAALAADRDCAVVVSTYNEPLITAEWARAVFELARDEDRLCAFVTNGNATPEVLDYLHPTVQLFKVDLKGFDDRRYRSLGGVLANVLRTLEELLARGAWLEVVTLVVPGFNDGEVELQRLAAHLASLSRDLPWHLTAFHPDYRMRDRPPTPGATISRARDIGLAAGLRHVYTGNVPGAVEGGEDTRCPRCGRTVVRRRGFALLEDRLANGRCPDCGHELPGRWTVHGSGPAVIV